MGLKKPFRPCWCVVRRDRTAKEDFEHRSSLPWGIMKGTFGWLSPVHGPFPLVSRTPWVDKCCVALSVRGNSLQNDTLTLSFTRSTKERAVALCGKMAWNKNRLKWLVWKLMHYNEHDDQVPFSVREPHFLPPSQAQQARPARNKFLPARKNVTWRLFVQVEICLRKKQGMKFS